jgi:GNAT superfamily N-acetyltransferase
MIDMPASQIRIRPATVDDAEAVAGLAEELAQSFPFSRTSFATSFPNLLDCPDACVLVALDGDSEVGYLLGFRHLTFYAGGPVASTEEILVSETSRGRGVGRALMVAFERWAARAGCVLVSVATRRAAPFYESLGYRESAAYLRKILAVPPGVNGPIRADVNDPPARP